MKLHNSRRSIYANEFCQDFSVGNVFPDSEMESPNLCGWTAAGMIVSGFMASRSDRKNRQSAERGRAASDQIMRDQMAEVKRQYNQSRADQMPWLESGRESLNQYRNMIYDDSKDPGLSQFYNTMDIDTPDEFEYDLESDPGYNFARDEATKGVNRAMAAGGKFNSGQRLAALADRITGVASQYANDAYNRQAGQYGINMDRNRERYGRNMTRFGLKRERESDLYNRRQNNLNRYASLSGLGQTSAQSLGSLGMNAAAQKGSVAGQRVAGINRFTDTVMKNRTARNNAYSRAFGKFAQGGMDYFGGF